MSTIPVHAPRRKRGPKSFHQDHIHPGSGGSVNLGDGKGPRRVLADPATHDFSDDPDVELDMMFSSGPARARGKRGGAASDLFDNNVSVTDLRDRAMACGDKHRVGLVMIARWLARALEGKKRGAKILVRQRAAELANALFRGKINAAKIASELELGPDQTAMAAILAFLLGDSRLDGDVKELAYCHVSSRCPTTPNGIAAAQAYIRAIREALPSAAAFQPDAGTWPSFPKAAE